MPACMPCVLTVHAWHRMGTIWVQRIQARAPRLLCMVRASCILTHAVIVISCCTSGSLVKLPAQLRCIMAAHHGASRCCCCAVRGRSWQAQMPDLRPGRTLAYQAGTTEGWGCDAEARLGNRDAMMHAMPGGMMPDLAQPAGLTDQERMANLIRQCMAPLPSVRPNRFSRKTESITWCLDMACQAV